MGFSKEWDEIYKNNQHMSIWPWSHLVSLCLRYTSLSSKDKDFSLLEVGCGAGANIPFFQAYTENVFAVDGSEHIVSILKSRFPSISRNIQVADFTKEIPFDNEFDLIVDRGASVSNDTDSIKRYLDLAYDKLKPGAHLIITDWFSVEHTSFQQGETVTGDPYTKQNYTAGPFANIGKIHFCDRDLITKLTHKFKLLHLEHVISSVEGNVNSDSVWHLVLQKGE